MRKCPFSYQSVDDRYQLTALKRLHPKLKDLQDLPYNSEELRIESRERSDRISIQGVQPKLSARLNLKEQCFEIVDRQGRFILKPQHADYSAVPENEDLTMKLAASVGITVPLHGLVYGRDGDLTYWIQRFDRVGRNQKRSMEDFCQLSGENRDTKYRSSLEKVWTVIQKYATFPQVEAPRLLLLVLFSFLCGNDDQHLKNFSLLQDGNAVRLSPAYDLLNTTILLKDPFETALPLRAKQRNLKAEDFLQYYAQERLLLQPPTIESTLNSLAQGIPRWPQLIEHSFLPSSLQAAYRKLVFQRCPRLGLHLLELTPTQMDALDLSEVAEAEQKLHRAFFRQLSLQRSGHWQCITQAQRETAHERRDQVEGALRKAYQSVCEW
jgi:serine/threonine-protein kinase HipA